MGIDVIGAIAMTVVALVIQEPLPGLTMAALAALAGVLAVAGILGLYTGLAVGRMGVVAPVTGLIAAALPVSAGFVSDGWPAPPVLVGIALALVAVALVSRTSDPAGRPSGIQYALIGGVGLGLFNIVVGLFPEQTIAWPLAIIKLGALLPIIAIVVVGSRPWRVPRPIVPAMILVAFLDLGGNAFYILATQVGRLDIAATLSSLYPVTTVVLAVTLLRERVTPSHVVGIVAAGVAIVLIAGGSAAPAT